MKYIKLISIKSVTKLWHAHCVTEGLSIYMFVAVCILYALCVQTSVSKFLEDSPLCFYANTNIHLNNVKHNTMLIISYI